MVKYFRVGLSFLLIFFLSAVGYAERLSVKETQSEGVKIVTVSNGFYVAEFTSKGGRLRSFIPNGGKDWVEWSPGKWEGGFFDDRDMRTVAVYGTKVYKRLSRVDIRFSYRDPLGIEWIKTFTIAKNSPVLKFSYKVLNLSGKEFVYEAMVRNMVVPGGSWSTKDYILFNDAEGIQNLRWTDFWTKEKESCKWVDYTVKPWQAVINRESGWALVFSFKEVGQLYFFRKGNLATMEFAFPKGLFKKGGALLFEGQMTLVKDFKTISYASSDLITGMSLNGSGIDLTVLPLLPASRQISVNTSLMDFRRNVVLSDIKTIIPPVMREGDISKVNIPLQIPGIERGPFIIAQSIYADNVKIAEYEMSWQGLFNLSTVGYRHPTAPISEEKRVTYKLTNEDVKRGYFVSQFQDEEERISTSAIEINIGREEKEWTRIGIESFKDIGDITCEIIETNFPGRIEEWTEENMQIRYSKVINNLSGGSNKAFWVRIDSSGVAPGEYNILLNISPVNADNIQIVMTVKVWDVLFPQSQSLEISWFHSGEESVIGRLFNGLERDKWLDIWEKSNRLLYDSGQTFFEFYPDSSKNDIAGQLITIPKKEGALPLLDFTRWDPYVEVARANGCKNVVFRYNWSAKTWLPNNLKDLESDSQEEVTLGILKQLYTYLKEQGFERVFT